MTTYKTKIKMVTQDHKRRIAKKAIEASGSYARIHDRARAFGIPKRDCAKISNGEIPAMPDVAWQRLAKLLIVPASEEGWGTARTPVFEYLTSQLRFCQENQACGMFCDDSDIGKSHTAKQYAIENDHAYYIDCSLCKARGAFVREIARACGLKATINHSTSNVLYRLQSHLGAGGKNTLIMLDEAGDLNYSAFLEIKALVNASENQCGWFMLGANGLRKKMESQTEREKVGYEEIFTRFGSRYQKVTPCSNDEKEEFRKIQIAKVAASNGMADMVQELYAKSGGSLRRLKTEIKKIKAAASANDGRLNDKAA